MLIDQSKEFYHVFIISTPVIVLQLLTGICPFYPLHILITWSFVQI